MIKYLLKPADVWSYNIIVSFGRNIKNLSIGTKTNYTIFNNEGFSVTMVTTRKFIVEPIGCHGPKFFL